MLGSVFHSYCLFPDSCVNVMGVATCQYQPISCNNSDLCFPQSCNGFSGKCQASPVKCNDSNLCTTGIMTECSTFITVLLSSLIINQILVSVGSAVLLIKFATIPILAIHSIELYVSVFVSIIVSLFLLVD